MMTKSNLDNVRNLSYNTGTIGRTLRFLLGTWLIFLVILYLHTANQASILMTLGITLGLMFLYILIHLVVSNYLPNLNPWFGALLAWIPAVLVFVLGGMYWQMGVLTFAGVSLLLAGARGDPGCEVMSIPRVISKKHTHLVCILFSPIDWLEEKIFRKRDA